jgi:hypothetical protein
VNVAHFHKVFRAPRRYHARAWVAPRGFTYRRFGIGERIPAVLLVADFFLTISRCTVLKRRHRNMSGYATAATRCWSIVIPAKSSRLSTTSSTKQPYR